MRVPLYGMLRVYGKNSFSTRSSAGCALIMLVYLCLMGTKYDKSKNNRALSIESVLAEKRRKNSSKMV